MRKFIVIMLVFGAGVAYAADSLIKDASADVTHTQKRMEELGL